MERADLPLYRRLGARVGAGVVLAAMALVVSSLGATGLVVRHDVVTTQSRHVRELGELFAGAAQAPVAFGDADMAQGTLDKLAPNLPGLISVEISGADEVMARWATDTPTREPIRLPFGDRLGPVWLEEVPIPGPGDAGDIGRVTIGVSNAHLAEVERSFVGILGLVAGIAAFGASLLGLGLARTLSPLQSMARAARAIADGDYEQRLNIDRSDEIGRLATAFCEMKSKVVSRERRIQSSNADMRLILDNVAQGLLILDLEGRIVGQPSAVLGEWFPRPTNTFFEVIEQIDAAQVEWFEMSWSAIADGLLPLTLLLHQLPTRCDDGERFFEFQYKPILDDGALEKLLVVVTNATERVHAVRALQKRQEFANLLVRALEDRAGFLAFYQDVSRLVQQVSRRGPQVMLALHTIKGNTGIWGLGELSRIVHEVESRCVEQGSLSDGDLRLLQNAWRAVQVSVEPLVAQLSVVTLDPGQYLAFLERLERAVPYHDLLRDAETWVWESARTSLERLSKQASRVAAGQGKSLVVEVEADELRTPETWMPFWSAMIHVIRNAIDHGVETADERAATGKPLEARIRLCVRVDDTIRVSVCDDGRGVAWDRVRRKARERGLPSETRADLVSALISSGLSTRDSVTSLSGRGVGLGATVSACEELGGHFEIESTNGAGSSFQFIFPRNAAGLVEPVA